MNCLNLRVKLAHLKNLFPIWVYCPIVVIGVKQF